MRTITRFFCAACRLILALVFILAFIQPCYAKRAPYVPALLQPWVDWVLHDKEEQWACIPQYNDPNIYQCNWPSELDVALNDKGCDFNQSWLVCHESWLALPGNDSQWPQDFQVDGESQIIIQQNKAPQIQLQPGFHMITGRFTWPNLPEYLQIPAGAALVSLTINNQKIAFPNLDASGRLWLKKIPVDEKIENRLKIESFRLIDDSIPSQVLLYFTLDVAGSAREIRLGPLYDPEKFTPLSLDSPLPARLEQDARMLVRLRPGRYSLRLNLRHTGPLHELSFRFPEDGLWPQQEIWSYRTQPDLRLVEIEGVPSIDPLQTSVPQDWKNYPAYRLLPGDTMRFEEIKRGDPAPAPDQLTLNRSLWLRFDGSGYTIQDTIKGKKNTNWRLEIDPAINLGRVAVDGSEQFITRRKGSDKAGVELRNGVLNLTADSIYQGNIAALPATGWDHDFQQAKGRLYLPPGWKLLHASGIDNIPRTWIKRWTLLDIFIVLIFTIALAKLFSKPLAGIALLTLVLTYHEPGAPRYVWLALLIGFTLLKYLDAAIPVPSHVKHWLPQEVLIDDTPAKGLIRKKNGLWVLVPAGKHKVKLSGSIRKQNTLQLPFPLKPHRAAIKADGWSVEGVHPDGTVDAQIQFKRIVKQDNKQTEILETGILPPFALVERNILIGLIWKIQTKITRLSPTGSAMVLDIPLIPGESVTTEGVRVTGGVTKINLRADQTHLNWESFLEPADQIVLKHKETHSWTEIWKVDISPIFHLEYEGIPVILHKSGTRWYPTWHPWPGEVVELNISRPAGIKGQTLTIENSHLELRPGQKTTAARLLLSIKSSQGGQHTILLPSHAKLQEVTIKGKIQPVRQDDRRVALPITPGHQKIEIKWLEEKGITTRYQSSAVDLGTRNVNASVDIYLPPRIKKKKKPKKPAKIDSNQKEGADLSDTLE